VKLVEKKTLERFEGKAKRVIDNRGLWPSPQGGEADPQRPSSD
jgi:hypothetical protein